MWFAVITKDLGVWLLDSSTLGHCQGLSQKHFGGRLGLSQFKRNVLDCGWNGGELLCPTQPIASHFDVPSVEQNFES